MEIPPLAEEEKAVGELTAVAGKGSMSLREVYEEDLWESVSKLRCEYFLGVVAPF